MKILQVDHIGIAVKNLEESVVFYKDVLGLEAKGIEESTEQKVKVVFLPCGDSRRELLESTSPDGPIARFIKKNGEGIQHIAFKVDNVGAILDELRRKGVHLIDEKPRCGAGGASIAFLHPKSTGGILFELSERK